MKPLAENAFRIAFRTQPETRSEQALRVRVPTSGAREPLHSSVVYLTKSKSLGYVPREIATLGLGAHA